jgi:hypothetical protein
MSNFQEFIENVKAGKIEGLEFKGQSNTIHTPQIFVIYPFRTDDSDHLCAHIRRWIYNKGDLCFNLSGSDLEIIHEDGANVFGEGAELDWHVDAANFVCKQGVEG